MLNNGITIIAENVQITGTTAVLTDYQIVNGCQTSHVLYENRNLDGIEELLIPIKVIGTKMILHVIVLLRQQIVRHQ